MPKRYAREFRRAVCARLVAGEKVGSPSKEVGISEGALLLGARELAGIRPGPSLRRSGLLDR
jgi:hypothetical protein